jgi:hypothetical protein
MALSFGVALTNTSWIRLKEIPRASKEVPACGVPLYAREFYLANAWFVRTILKTSIYTRLIPMPNIGTERFLYAGKHGLWLLLINRANGANIHVETLRVSATRLHPPFGLEHLPLE